MSVWEATEAVVLLIFLINIVPGVTLSMSHRLQTSSLKLTKPYKMDETFKKKKSFLFYFND